MRNSPSISKILLTDYFFFTGALAMIIGVGISAYTYFTETNLLVSAIFAGTACLGLMLMIWRIIFIYKLFKIGAEVEGIISKVGYYRGRANIRFTFTFESVEYKSYNILMRNSKTTHMPAESKIILLINPSNPKQALIFDVYQ